MSNYVTKYNGIIDSETKNKIIYRYKIITKAVNKNFWSVDADSKNSLIVGSYERRTAVDTSDIDMLVILPSEEFDHVNNLKGNSQSRLLQVVKNSIVKSYPRTNIRADGQVIKVEFSDGIKFEVVPVFKSIFGLFIYPDTNDGGTWKSTKPKAEQKAMEELNTKSKGLLIDTCRHIRVLRDYKFSSYKLSGIVIDSFVCSAIGTWVWCADGETSSYPKGTYESKLLEYFNNNLKYSRTIYAPGSNDVVDLESSKLALEKVLILMNEK